MVNIPKCVALLEHLKMPPATGIDDRLIDTLPAVIQKHLQLTAADIHQSAIFSTDPPYPHAAAADHPSPPASWLCSTHLTYVLRTIVDDTSPAGSSTPLEPRHQQLVIAWLAATARLHIAANLEAALLQNPLLSAVRANSQLSAAERTSYLRATVVVFAGFFEHRWLLDSGALDATIVAYMSALHWYACDDAAADDDHHWSRRLLHQLHSAAAAGRYIRFVLVIKANRELPARLHDRLHRDLLRCVHRTDGYEQLVRSMLPVAAAAAASPPPSPPLARICTAVGHICAHPHQQLVGFHAGVREQCGRLIERSRTPGSVLRQPELQLLALCAHDTLVRMHRTAPDGFGQRPAIERLVFAGLAELSAPGDVLAGRVLQQHDQLLAGLQWVADAFLAAPAQPDRLRLPAAVLRPWLPLLLQLHSRLPAPVAQLPGRLVVYCLANVDGQPALGAELVRLLGERWLPDGGDRVLHERVTVVEQQSGRVTVQIGAADAVQPAFRAGDTLWSVLRDSGHNRLLYDVFVQLLGQLAEPEALRPVAGNGDQLLVHDADELAAVAHARCARTLAALQLLGDLIEHRPWQRLFGEQPADGLQAMRQLAEGRLRALRQWRETGDRERLDAERTDRTSGMLMAIVHEFVAGLEERRRLEVSAEFGRTLHEYRAVTANAEVRCQIDAVLGLLGGVGEEEEEQRQPPNAGEADSASTRFERALRMCAEPEPYVRVFGLRELERMVRGPSAQRCAELVAQRFTVLSVAAEALRSDESYVFLNATRLLVALLGLMEADVVEAMLAEYERSAVGVDERLKVGEVIVKLVEELGPVAYKYKGRLFDCFLRGCRHSDADLRTSSLSSLATLMRLFAYQVHAFFHELAEVTQRIVEHDAHQPCRRAAVMVLAQMLAGVDELQQFEAILNPVHRTFRWVVQHESDETTLVHARLGLERLQLMVAKFMTVEQKPKEIRIFGINEPQRSGEAGKKASILEIL